MAYNVEKDKLHFRIIVLMFSNLVQVEIQVQINLLLRFHTQLIRISAFFLCQTLVGN